MQGFPIVAQAGRFVAGDSRRLRPEIMHHRPSWEPFNMLFAVHSFEPDYLPKWRARNSTNTRVLSSPSTPR